MPIILFLAIAGTAVLFVLTKRGYKLSDLITSNLFMVIFAGMIVRILVSFMPLEHPTDIACFMGWADTLFKDGLSAFYTSEGFHDYPPGYMYVLYVTGLLRSVFNISYGGYTHILLIKLPSMLADIGAGVLIYLVAQKHLKEKAAFGLALLYVLNPAVWVISSVWGQVDAVHTLVIAASVYLLTRKKTLPAFMLYTLSFIIKPQAFMFAPVYLFYVWDYLREGQFKPMAFLEMAKSAAICVAQMLLLFLPFTTGFFDFTPIITQYADTLASYPYASVNAYNLWGALGQNWAPIDKAFMNVPYGNWGTFFIVLIVIFSFRMLHAKKTPANYFFTTAMINICTFMLSVKMHERYAFPALALLLTACALEENRKLKRIYLGFSAVMLINYIDVMRVGLMGFDWSLNSFTSVIFSLLMLVPFVYALIVAAGPLKKDSIRAYANAADAPEEKEGYSRKDFLAMGATTAVYAVFAFVNLGNLHSPQTMWEAKTGQEAIVDFGSPQDISRMQYFIGPRHDRKFSVEISGDGQNWESAATVDTNSVFKWSEVSINATARYAKITVISNDSYKFYMAEAAFRNSSDELLPVISDTETLFDEQQYVPETDDYMNGTYFDEIYHPRTAYEFVHGLPVYENTHPPLGKVFISWGVRLFGMTPFGWRFAGTLFGVLMVPLIYMFAKRMLKGTLWASCAAVFFAFDFMHFAQTRLATIDTYITFFVIAMYYAMYVYSTMSFYKTKLWKTLVPLFFSGLFMGLGVASKWPGVYAGIGLAVLFFITIGRRYAEYRQDKKKRKKDKNSHSNLPFYRNTAITLACCLLFFVIVPVIIYVLSYIPFYYSSEIRYFSRESFQFLTPALEWLLPDNAYGNFICSVIQNQINMYDYHSKLVAEHPYSSVWWQWMLDIKPIFYYSSQVPGTHIKQGISSFGNPLVWWGGLAAMLYCVSRFFNERGKTELFLIIAYLAQLVPWVFVPRLTFIYHYFPCVPFLALALAYALKRLSRGNRTAIILMAVTFGLFILFYPVLSGMPVDYRYVVNFLRLPFMKHWQLI